MGNKIITTRAVCNEVNIKVNEPPKLYADDMYYSIFVKVGDPSLDLNMSFESIGKVQIETEE